MTTSVRAKAKLIPVRPMSAPAMTAAPQPKRTSVNVPETLQVVYSFSVPQNDFSNGAIFVQSQAFSRGKKSPKITRAAKPVNGICVLKVGRARESHWGLNGKRATAWRCGQKKRAATAARVGENPRWGQARQKGLAASIATLYGSSPMSCNM